MLSFQVGLDALEKNHISMLESMKVGVIANHTSLNAEGKHLIDILIDEEIELVRIFSPEHGFLGKKAAGETVDNETHSLSGVEIVSLYGKNKSPEDADLRDLDVLIFDIQDIGVRYYTYVDRKSVV